MLFAIRVESGAIDNKSVPASKKNAIIIIIVDVVVVVIFVGHLRCINVF